VIKKSNGDAPVGQETDGLIIERFDLDGNLIERFIGPSTGELLLAHNAGECHAFCPICVTEAERMLGENFGGTHETRY
jgi:hypothetical protein